MAVGERTLETGRVPVAEQFAYWRESVSDAFLPVGVERDGEGPFAGSIRATAAGPLGIARIASQAQRVLRTPRSIERPGGDAFYLNCQLRGTGGATQDGRAADLRPGDLTMVDSTRPFELSFGASFGQLCFTIPRELLAPRLAAPDANTAVRIPGDHGAGALASTALRTLALHADGLDRETARAAAEHVAGLAALALARSAPSPASASHAALLQAALDEVERHLADPALTPSSIATRISVSTRHLHRLFAARGTTFGRWVLDRRLAGARRDLADSAFDHWTIGELAHRWGFADPSYFARAFRARHGLSPREHRRAARFRSA